MKKTSLLICLLILIMTSCKQEKIKPANTELWYRQPAKTWTEALPVGNGRLGGMVFGRYHSEIIQLNEESLWAGSKMNNNNPEALDRLPEIREAIFKSEYKKALELSNKYLLGTPPRIRSYQPLGNLSIVFGHQGEPVNYKRSLNLNTGVARTEFEIDGNKIVQEVFVSSPHDVMVVTISGGQPFSADILLSRERDTAKLPRDRNGRKRPVFSHYENEYSNENGIAYFTGQIIDIDNPLTGPGGRHMRYAAAMKMLEGSKSAVSLVTDSAAGFTLKNTKKIVILLTGATDYNIEKLDTDESKDPYAICAGLISAALENNERKLRKVHEADHRRMFDRVSFSLGEDLNAGIPTDERLDKIKKGGIDDGLISIYFQYGRYLLMGSSRKPGVLPANLQGIWNDQYEAPWNSDFHTNINLQMNYWHAEICNLPETSEVLAGFMEKLMVPGAVTATEMYGTQGWTLHHLTDPFGRTGVADGVWGITPMDGPWMTFPVYEHFLFTGDTAYLRSIAYPMMKGAAEFVLGFLVESPEGYLVTNPSHSPENDFRDTATGEISALTYAASTDIQMITSLFNYCTEAAATLGTDKEFSSRISEAKKKLPPVVINSKGVIQEWIKDYDEPEPGHRHMSHLLGLYPLSLFTPDTPELFNASRATIERRLSFGGGHTGWSRAWIINLFARLGDGEKAYENLNALLAKSTLTNLFDTHPPFQIDGNFGGTAGIAEMLIQSHEGKIRLLPAIPADWKEGGIKGIRARGGFGIDMKWSDGKITAARIYSEKGGETRVMVNNTEIIVNLKPGESREL
jgi:alpha-L-fucosidase 2